MALDLSKGFLCVFSTCTPTEQLLPRGVPKNLSLSAVCDGVSWEGYALILLLRVGGP